MKKIEKTAKLSLSKESVRKLSNAHLEAVAGGLISFRCTSDISCDSCRVSCDCSTAWPRGKPC
jgi:hypothetical protein